MTLIFYDGTDLHCDRRMASHTVPVYFKDHAIKWYRSSDNQFAWGLSGRLPATDSEVKKTQISLRDIMELYHASSKFDCRMISDISEKHGEVLNGRYVILSQRKAVLVSCDGKDDKNSFILNLTGTLFAVGSSPQRATGIHRITRDVKKTFELVAQTDKYTSAEYDTVTAESLSPFIIA